MEPLLPPPRRSWPRRLLNRLEIDRATFYSLLVRVWQLTAGPVTMLLIARHFSAELQGYYYTFGAIFAWQGLADLGLQVVIVNLAGHEWAHLALDEQGRIVGDPTARARLIALGRFVVGWYAVAALLFPVVVGAGGYLLLADRPPAGVAWLVPWGLVTLITAVSLWAMPLMVLLDGCGQNAVTYRYRSCQAISGSLATWVAILLGWNLWTIVASSATRLFWELYPLAVRYRRFFAALRSRPTHAVMDWRREIWPLQWRIAIQGAASYLVPALLVPIMLRYHGPQVAGRTGMTWVALSALQLGALSWVIARGPRFNVLVARREFAELDRIYDRLLRVSLGLLGLGGLAFCGVVLLLHQFADGHDMAGLLPREVAEALGQLSSRLLPPLPTALFTAALVLMHVPQCQAIYIRAHKRDPLLVISSLSGVTSAILVWMLGSRVGPTGAAAGLLGVTAGFTLPATTFVWRHARAEWHDGASE